VFTTVQISVAFLSNLKNLTNASTTQIPIVVAVAVALVVGIIT